MSHMNEYPGDLGAGPSAGEDAALGFEAHTSPPSPPAAPSYAGAGELPRKNPAVAGVLSAILPGLGNLYLGYTKMGFLQVVVFGGTITLLATEAFPALAPLLGIFLGFWWFFGIIDAHRKAKLYNHFLVRGADLPGLPGDLDLPGEGSLTGGILTVAVGLLLFLHTRFDLSLTWVEDWWPLILVGFGVWLIVQARRGSSRP